LSLKRESARCSEIEKQLFDELEAAAVVVVAVVVVAVVAVLVDAELAAVVVAVVYLI
jgi:hypothetical protein